MILDLIPNAFISAHPLIINIGCSVAASFAFLFLVLILLKPKIKISPFLTQGLSLRPDEGVVYTLKIVNKSFFIGYDVRVEMHVLRKIPMPGEAYNAQLIIIPLVVDSLTTIAGRRPMWWDKGAPHCAKFRTTKDLSTILADPMSSVRVRVISRHGLTGLSNVHTQEYTVQSQVVAGQFTSGPKFDHIP
jgi:hypothetical protein